MIIKLYVAFLYIVVIFASAARADETIYSMKNADGSTLKIKLAATRPATLHPASEPTKYKPTTETGESWEIWCQDWRAELISADGKETSLLYQTELYTVDPKHDHAGIIPFEPYEVLSAKVIDHGVIAIINDRGIIRGVVGTNPEQLSLSQTDLMADPRHFGDTKSKVTADISGDFAKGTIVLTVTAPDKSIKQFKLIVNGDTARWVEN